MAGDSETSLDIAHFGACLIPKTSRRQDLPELSVGFGEIVVAKIGVGQNWCAPTSNWPAPRAALTVKLVVAMLSILLFPTYGQTQSVQRTSRQARGLPGFQSSAAWHPAESGMTSRNVLCGQDAGRVTEEIAARGRATSALSVCFRLFLRAATPCTIGTRPVKNTA